MKLWEKYYQKGRFRMLYTEKIWSEMWERFVSTGECGSLPCTFCPFAPTEYPCKEDVSPEVVIKELNKEEGKK